MACLFLSFADRLNKNLKLKNELYNLSLKEQFEQIQKRIPLEKQSSDFNQFIECCFPTNLKKKYYFSCPNFLREKNFSKSGNVQYLDNVVVRPEFTASMAKVLPNNQNIILIGKIVEGNRQKILEIKGIQLIDSSICSPNDIIVEACVCNSFKFDTAHTHGNVWSISNISYENTLLTPDFVYNLIQSCWTVNKPEKVREIYEKWNKYIQFRNYYINEQEKRNFKLERTLFINAYAVNRKDYKKNASIYHDYLLDGLNEFSKGDMIVLSEKIEDAELFSLIRLDIERNKKQFNESKIMKKGKLLNEEERKIRSLSSDNVFITSIDPKSNSQFKDTNGNNQLVTLGEMMNSGYVLGDRFKIILSDVFPNEHLAKIEEEYTQTIKKNHRNIEIKYEKIINRELENAVNNYSKDLQENNNVKIKKFKQNLDESLEKDIELNADEKIIETIKRKKKEIKSFIKNNNKKEKTETNEEYQHRIDFLLEKEFQKLDIKSLYIERNEKKLIKFEKELENEKKAFIAQYKTKKKVEINNKYSNDIRNEKNNIKKELEEKLKQEKNKIIDEETIIRFSLYFKLNETNNVINDKQMAIIEKCNYIVYDSRAEKAKIQRQEQALKNFYSGYVKNPYLSTYLFNPEELNNIQIETSDWIWYLDSLNEKQKEAVRKAVSSNGIFLLQGPPGTGKTQVIAETVAHLVKNDKKVLISSETHKAIDNVFERLPKIAEIVPIRLISSNNDKKKNNEFDPKFLVDNFYLNVSSDMKKSIARYKNFKENKVNFDERFNQLKLLKSKIEKSQKTLDKANEEIKQYEDKAKNINSKILMQNEKIDDIKIESDILRRTLRCIQNDNLKIDEDIKSDIILKYRGELEPLFDKEIFALEQRDLGQIVKSIYNIKYDEIEKEISVINPDSSRTKLEIRRKEIKNEMEKCKDEFDDVLPEKEEEYKKLRSELIKIKKELDLDNNDSIMDLKLNEIFKYSYLVNNNSKILQTFQFIKEKIPEIKCKYIESVNKKIDSIESKQNLINKNIDDLKKQINTINDNIIDIQEKNGINEIQELKFRLENDLIKFFKDFEILEPYKNLDEALDIIKNKWNELENDFETKEKENKEKIPMYEKIVNYISNKDVIEDDRKKFTKDLFENANVFGVTCTSNDRFSGKNIDALYEYNIEDTDIKSLGIDVVIIDEVSKSSFIDLLIPILYGKTIILVGDHRQLPPMYEFSKLREDDFEGLDDTIINPEINEQFTKLYEECFFKTLFEKIPTCFKTMLVQQYRCHEHIMNVFNHFYRKELKLGFKGQNNYKKHNIKLLTNGRYIIEPEKHVYFVDCKQTETRDEDSTSIYNTNEAKVVIELIKKMNSYFKEHIELEKLSIGIICTYGDQAKKIKELMRTEKIKIDGFKTDVEKFIVSTVDDFQGDERDIIILSTVRNPEDFKKSNPGFILAYQRINVALSRARRLLIILGNRKYLETKGVIDLPDIYGRKSMTQKNFRVYEEILSTIEQYGKILEDIDIFEDEVMKING